MQGINRKISEHSLVLLDPMRSIQNQHIQQRKKVYRTKLGMETKHIPNHPNHLNLRNPTSFCSHHFKDNEIQLKIKVRNQRNKEFPEEEGQRMSGSLTRNNLNRIRKFLIFPQVDKSTYLIQRNQVFLTCSYPQEQPKKATKCARNAVKLDIGNVIVGLQPGVNSVHLKHMQHKPAEDMQISLGITPLHPVEG